MEEYSVGPTEETIERYRKLFSLSGHNLRMGYLNLSSNPKPEAQDEKISHPFGVLDENSILSQVMDFF
jgi:hypothetical protein